MLTDRECRLAKAGPRDQKKSDSKGLHLFVTTKGYKSWRWKYRFGGQEKLITFGPYPEISLAEARDLRDESAKLLRSGIDPSVERKQRKAAIAIDAANTFEAIARQWHAMAKPKWSPHHAEDVLTSLEKLVFPKLGSVPIKSITPPMVLQVLRAIEARPAVETARRVRQRISAIFAFAASLGIDASDPASVVRGSLKPVQKGRQPAFTRLADAQALLKATEEAPGYPVTKLASRFLALTAARPGMVRFAVMNEFEGLDGPEPLWRIPARRMKLKADRKKDETYDFIMPLSCQAAEAIKVIREFTGDVPFIFPNNRHVHRPMSENAIGYMYNRIANYRGRHVPHGWRSSCSTIMNEWASQQGLPGDRAVIDYMLAHIPQGVEGIYNRAIYLDRRRVLAQQWADMLLEGFPPAAELVKGVRK
jgi:integrase